MDIDVHSTICFHHPSLVTTGVPVRLISPPPRAPEVRGSGTKRHVASLRAAQSIRSCRSNTESVVGDRIMSNRSRSPFRRCAGRIPRSGCDGRKRWAFARAVRARLHYSVFGYIYTALAISSPGVGNTVCRERLECSHSRIFRLRGILGGMRARPHTARSTLQGGLFGVTLPDEGFFSRVFASRGGNADSSRRR